MTWSRYHDRCRSCRSTERPHNAHGLCSRCYQCAYYRANYALDRVAVEDARRARWRRPVQPKGRDFTL